jgi:photosystem II stability/assembly factor-like uncharacterized protein
MKKILLVIPFFLIFFHLMYASDGPQVWTQDLTTTTGVWQHCIIVNPTNQQIMYAGINGTGVYKTTNGGTNWTLTTSGLNNVTVFNMAIAASNPNVIYLGTSQTGGGAGMYISTDAGATWTQINAGIVETSLGVGALAVDPTNPAIAYMAIFDGLVDSPVGLYKTTNSGTLWVPSNAGVGTIKNFLSININPLNHNVVYAGTSFSVATSTGPSQIYRSNNAGTTWFSVSNGLPPASTDINPVRDMSISTLDTARVLAGLFQNALTGGAFLTTNGGTSWTRMSTGIPNVLAVNIRSVLIQPGSSTTFFAGLDVPAGQTGGVYTSTDAGNSWTAFNGGTMQSTYVVRALNWRTTDLTLFAGVAGTSGFGVHEYTFPPNIVIDPGPGVPKNFSLNQNYPNPFNPSTIIEYAVPKTAFVTVKVYDLMGKEVKTLVSETKQTGYYSLTFNASNLTSGVYFYKIIAGDFTASKKMMLVK